MYREAYHDYYPFGMTLPDRTWQAEGYRYGFQGQEADDEVFGADNAIAFPYRMYDARIGRFLSIDPLAAKYPWNSPYAFSENRVIDAVELEGLELSTIRSPYWSKKLYNSYINGTSVNDLVIKIEGDIMLRGFSMHPDGEEAGRQYAVNNLGYTNSIVDVTETTPGFTAIYGIMSTEEGPISYTIVARNSEGGFADQNATPREDNRSDWEKFWGPGGGPHFLLNGETSLEGEISGQEALPIIKGTATIFFGVITLGQGTLLVGVMGGTNVLLGIDEIATNEDGLTAVEVWISDENVIAAYRGAKTVFAFVGGVKTAIDFSSGSDLALEVMSVLNDSRSYIEGLLYTDEMFSSPVNED